MGEALLAGSALAAFLAGMVAFFALGDFFAVWGVRFGGGTLGSLRDDASDRVWVYVNGKLITDPARHLIANGDDISVGYGPKGSFPHKPGTSC
jgi:hypothetical protein